MRRGNRRGQATADSLRLRIRQEIEDDSESSGDESEGPDSPSTTSPPSSPTGTTKPSQSLPESTKSQSNPAPPTATTTLSNSGAPQPPTSTTLNGDPGPVATAVSSSSSSSEFPSSDPKSTSVPPDPILATSSTFTSTLSTSTMAGPVVLPTATQVPSRETAEDPGNTIGSSAVQRNSKIIGAAVGSIAGAIVIAVLALLFLYKYRKRRRGPAEEDEQRLTGVSAQDSGRQPESQPEIIEKVGWQEPALMSTGNEQMDVDMGMSNPRPPPRSMPPNLSPGVLPPTEPAQMASSSLQQQRFQNNAPPGAYPPPFVPDPEAARSTIYSTSTGYRWGY